MRRFVNIYANEEDIRFLATSTPRSKGDAVSIVPAIAGGCALTMGLRVRESRALRTPAALAADRRGRTGALLAAELTAPVGADPGVLAVARL